MYTGMVCVFCRFNPGFDREGIIEDSIVMVA
jgi:hypothetical protein